MSPPALPEIEREPVLDYLDARTRLLRSLGLDPLSPVDVLDLRDRQWFMLRPSENQPALVYGSTQHRPFTKGLGDGWLDTRRALLKPRSPAVRRGSLVLVVIDQQKGWGSESIVVLDPVKEITDDGTIRNYLERIMVA